MNLKYKIRGVVFAISLSMIILMLGWVLHAMLLGGGKGTLYVNNYYEGWFEVGLLASVVVRYIWALWRYIRN